MAKLTTDQLFAEGRAWATANYLAKKDKIGHGLYYKHKWTAQIEMLQFLQQIVNKHCVEAIDEKNQS
jgi:hypothetical protein